MVFVIIDIAAWDGSFPRKAIIKRTGAEEQNVLLYPHVGNTVSAVGMSKDWKTNTGSENLFVSVNGIPLKEWTAGIEIEPAIPASQS